MGKAVIKRERGGWPRPWNGWHGLPARPARPPAAPQGEATGLFRTVLLLVRRGRFVRLVAGRNGLVARATHLCFGIRAKIKVGNRSDIESRALGPPPRAPRFLETEALVTSGNYLGGSYRNGREDLMKLRVR